MALPKLIALCGHSGAGKSEVSKFLMNHYGYKVCSVGKRCRELSMEFFESESKEILDKVTTAMYNIEKGIWLKVALKKFDIAKDLIAVDSIRFPEDFDKLKGQFSIWRIESNEDTRFKRLEKRGQVFTPEDDKYFAETILDDYPVNFVINNDFLDINDLHQFLYIFLNENFSD